MSAFQALKAARYAGIRIVIDGDAMTLDADAAPPAAVLNLLSRHKAGVVALLRTGSDGWSGEDWRCLFDEREGKRLGPGLATRLDAKLVDDGQGGPGGPGRSCPRGYCSRAVAEPLEVDSHKAVGHLVQIEQELRKDDAASPAGRSVLLHAANWRSQNSSGKSIGRSSRRLISKSLRPRAVTRSILADARFCSNRDVAKKQNSISAHGNIARLVNLWPASYIRVFLRIARRRASLRLVGGTILDAGPSYKRAHTLQCTREISKSLIFLPVLSCAPTQRGCLPRPDQVSEGRSGFRYFGCTFG
jgi:hypothetical protein